MKTTVIGVLGALVLSSTALASFSEFQSQSQLWLFPLSPGNQALVFDQFDDNGGTFTLKAIEMRVDGFMQANVTAENDSTISIADFGVTLTGIIDVNVDVLAASLGIVQAAGPVAVTGTDGVQGSGTDFHDFGVVVGSDSDSAVLFGPAMLPFIGVGTINGSVGGNGGFSAQGTADATIVFSDFGTYGKVELIYYYDIPTSGTATLAGLALLTGLRRRRS